MPKSAPSTRSSASRPATTSPRTPSRTPSRTPPHARIEAITPSGRSRWNLALSDGRTVRLDAGAAQSAGIRVGGRWNERAAARVAEAVEELALFAGAMKFLARGGAATRAALVARLGRGAAARRAIANLAKDGWIS